jgi:hypothetical protein
VCFLSYYLSGHHGIYGAQKIIQNKFHYAITGNTAAEIVYKRVDSKEENMGLITWEN